MPKTYGGFDETMVFEPEIREIANEYYSEYFSNEPSFKGKKFHNEALGFSQVTSYLESAMKYKKDTNRTETDRRKNRRKNLKKL